MREMTGRRGPSYTLGLEGTPWFILNPFGPDASKQTRNPILPLCPS